ncbi:L-asparaginase/GlutRNAGln amidotransferase subunit D [Burkholderiales bacterium JOSHI_001]|nr:L-asparaginase/GlutRNAGln amidotransferase subunit D [Burkholderiales bacterium JOSHI_001]
MTSTVVILGTGGTIAGRNLGPVERHAYRAGELSAAELVAAVPALAASPVEAESLAQIDSKDMGFAVWQRLAQRVAQHLARPEVAGVVVTHGTDTLEESAYFLHRVLSPGKPVVFTAAMRPATAPGADGPANLLDAVALAGWGGPDRPQGVLAVLGGVVHGAADVRKADCNLVDAFDSGEAGALARLEGGVLRRWRAWPAGPALGLATVAAAPETWPAVEILISHAQARGAVVDALLGSGAAGLVVAGTGNGTLHADLEVALKAAHARGVPVWRCTRCARGAVVGRGAGALPHAGALSPVKARIELMLQLLADKAA